MWCQGNFLGLYVAVMTTLVLVLLLVHLYEQGHP